MQTCIIEELERVFLDRQPWLLRSALEAMPPDVFADFADSLESDIAQEAQQKRRKLDRA